jgi:hypothetical protein
MTTIQAQPNSAGSPIGLARSLILATRAWILPPPSPNVPPTAVVGVDG